MVKIVESWLREWIDTPSTVHDIGDKLTAAGLELEHCLPVAPPFSNVVVALVEEVHPHPDANKLTVCTVDAGAHGRFQVVCGAANVRAGLKVPFALVGAALPGGLQIKKAKLRGVDSFGMLCAATELGLSAALPGLLELPADAPVGMDIRKYLYLDDHVLELSLTPNRGDCASVLGVARELAALERLPLLKNVLLSEEKESTVAASKTPLQVRVLNPEACPVYCAQRISGLALEKASPLWLQERLRRAGQRSINLIVDVTNYVMLELGQPLHAFDAAVIGSEVEVRFANASGPFELLDGQTLELSAEDLVIANAEGVLALAGIMGGACSGIQAETQAIVLESAHFNMEHIRASVNRHRLHTEASYRFERGVDPSLPMRALQRATDLILSLAGGTPEAPVYCMAVEHGRLSPAIVLTKAELRRYLGIEIPSSEVEALLTALQMQVQRTQDDRWSVVPPAFRFDIQETVDLIEEVARCYGYDRIPLQWTHPAVASPLQMSLLKEYPLDLRSFWSQRGYREIITYSFVAPEDQKQIDPTLQPLRLANPISEELSVMRTSLWPGLLRTLEYNAKRQVETLRLFEQGVCFVPGVTGLSQSIHFAGLLCGSVSPLQWGNQQKAVDFFTLKGDLEGLLSDVVGLSLQEGLTLEAISHPALQSGQCARFVVAGKTVAILGLLHPTAAKYFDLKMPVYLFELYLDLLPPPAPLRFVSLSKYPAIRRDLAFLVDESLSAAMIQKKLKENSPKCLKSLQIFDIYCGGSIPIGRKSVAIAFIFQDPERTLLDVEVDQTMADMVLRIESEFGANLRA